MLPVEHANSYHLLSQSEFLALLASVRGQLEMNYQHGEQADANENPIERSDQWDDLLDERDWLTAQVQMLTGLIAQATEHQ